MEYCTFSAPRQGFTYEEQLAFALATERSGFDGFFRSANICGDATEVAAKVGRLIDLGAQRVYFQTVDMRDLDQTAYLGDEVLPQLPR